MNRRLSLLATELYWHHLGKWAYFSGLELEPLWEKKKKEAHLDVDSLSQSTKSVSDPWEMFALTKHHSAVQYCEHNIIETCHRIDFPLSCWTKGSQLCEGCVSVTDYTKTYISHVGNQISTGQPKENIPAREKLRLKVHKASLSPILAIIWPPSARRSPKHLQTGH